MKFAAIRLFLNEKLSLLLNLELMKGCAWIERCSQSFTLLLGWSFIDRLLGFLVKYLYDLVDRLVLLTHFRGSSEEKIHSIDFFLPILEHWWGLAGGILILFEQNLQVGFCRLSNIPFFPELLFRLVCKSSTWLLECGSVEPVYLAVHLPVPKKLTHCIIHVGDTKAHLVSIKMLRSFFGVGDQYSLVLDFMWAAHICLNSLLAGVCLLIRSYRWSFLLRLESNHLFFTRDACESRSWVFLK